MTSEVTVPAAALHEGRTTGRAARTGPAGTFVKKGLVLVGAALAAVLFLYPLVWLISASLKPRTQVFNNELVPDPLRAENYGRLIAGTDMSLWLVNSVVVGVAAAVAVTLSSGLVAFGFAYFRFPGRNLLFTLVLSTMMLPAAVTLIPTFLIWQELGLANTQVPLWAQNLFGSAFYIFLLRQFFLGLPRDTFEAARVDGASFFGLFWRIALPLVKPAMILVFVFEFRASWVDLLRPLVYLQDSALYTVPRGLKSIIDAYGWGGEAQWEIVMAASALATLPMIVLFFLAQRHFMDGIATQGRKG